MTSPPLELLSGYRRFRATRYREEAARYSELADGQAPRIMVVACADSRVDPATIFGAAPGELFVVRNVANLVPPCEQSPADLHGTSAALEFAVTQSRVAHIVVLGHGGCGGVAASLAAADDRPVGRFIAPWVELLADTRDKVLSDLSLSAPADRQTALEHGGIQRSLENLMTFPFVAAAVQAGSLALHGAWFSIGNGILHWLDRDTGQFEMVEA